MELHSHDKRHRDFTGHTCPAHLSEASRRGVHVAMERAKTALKEGRLLTPGEALALAGPEARHDETLFSIARAAAWESGGSQDDILCHLGEHFPGLT
jgi:hypothetical protein